MSRRVVITGVGAITPLGVGVKPLIERWSAGECGIEDGFGRAREFDPLDFLSKKEARRSDRFTQMAIAAGAEAISQAGGEDGLPYEPHRVGCVIGTGIGGLPSLEENQRKLIERGEKAVSPLAVPLMMGNAAAAAVAMRHDLHGHTYGVVSACAAGAHALGDASRIIRAGDADAVVSGGAEAAISGVATAAFAAMEATSPTGISRPFDARRDGFVMGEGAGVLVLEEKEAAEARGAEILGELLGYGATCDGYHLTAPQPEGTEAARAISLAVADAGLSAIDVDYVNAHGTSTPLNDRSETVALKAALGERAADIPVSSTKSAIGHLLGAAGAVEAIATVEALRRKTAPPTVGWEEPEEGLDLDYVPGSSKPIRNGEGPLVGVSNSFGFGGHNAVLVLAA
ncbi:MAG: 3-oxoacyl-[acyl-carrier-protein] synthase [Solirubrobacterales bacterium]|jgi:3-oxoacyl-[acyl-carrier-protein] synthase II|nr:3-oxoacyl-[acyl-carrier-protein] synthase [Solirubrobacterales bacterium]